MIGEDRPGILAAVSGILFANGCNIENISQTILQSVFGALFIASIPRNTDEKGLQKKLGRELSYLKLEVFVKEYDSAEHHKAKTQPFVITTFGPDRPGLVNAITRIFADHEVNVTNLNAVFKGGDDPGDNMMIFEVEVPDDVSLPELQDELQQTAVKNNLDVNIQHRKIFETMNRI